MYSFDQHIERRGTYASKYEALSLLSKDPEHAIPLFVADMDFAVPDPVLHRLEGILRHEIFGYTVPTKPYYEAVVRWFGDRYGWHFQKEAVAYGDGTISCLRAAIREFSRVGDGVMITRPVYGHFTEAIVDETHRVAVDSHLLYEDGRWTMDFDDIERKAADPRNRIFILCNPHNPIGRVWTAEEIQRVYDIIRRHHMVMISDEVHADLTRTGILYHPAGKVIAEKDHLIVLTGINKTFNVAGLKCSNAIIEDDELRARYLKSLGMKTPTPFAIGALIASYTECDTWVDELRAYLDGNIDAALAVLREIPGVQVDRPEGTYCLWIDFSGTGLTAASVREAIYEEANVILQDGIVHDPEFGAFCHRMCVPLPRAKLLEACERMRSALCRRIQEAELR